ncbi:MAG: hypothetical protein LUH15_13120 [Tannerellaceae bacterium]|nr:hypothetical protein [Tannerellaceae bacterium]
MGIVYMIARYTTPEALYGKNILRICEDRTPEESKQRIIEYISNLLPKATHSQILKLIE